MTAELPLRRLVPRSCESGTSQVTTGQGPYSAPAEAPTQSPYDLGWIYPDLLDLGTSVSPIRARE